MILWPGKLRSNANTRPANSSGRRRISRASSVCSPARAFPVIAPSLARPARAVITTASNCGNGALPGPFWLRVPVQPNIARFAGVSARATSTPPVPHTGIPPSTSTGPPSPSSLPSPASGPATFQNSSSITAGGSVISPLVMCKRSRGGVPQASRLVAGSEHSKEDR